jgi:hypothetical protein
VEDTDSDEDEEDAQDDKEESKKKPRNDLLEEVKVHAAHQYLSDDEGAGKKIPKVKNIDYSLSSEEGAAARVVK